MLQDGQRDFRDHLITKVEWSCAIRRRFTQCFLVLHHLRISNLRQGFVASANEMFNIASCDVLDKLHETLSSIAVYRQLLSIVAPFRDK